MLNYMGKLKYAPYSPSKLALYELCPARWRMKYVEKLPDPSGPAAQLGKAVHDAVAYLLKGDEEAALSAIAGAPDYEEAKKLFNNIKWLMSDLRRETDLIATEVRFAMDAEFNIVDFRSSEAVFRGIIDLLTYNGEEVWIIDWKTGRADPDPKQLVLYAFALSQLGVPQKFGPITKVRFGLIRSREWLDFPLNEAEDFGIVEAWLKRKIREIETDNEFKPRPGPHCAYCPYINRCVTAKELHEITDPIEALRRAEMLSELAKRYKAFAREYVKNTGEILEVDGRKFGPRESQVVKIVDKRKVWDIVREREDWDKFIKFDSKALMGLPEVGRLLKVKTRTTIDWIKEG